ncbi:hypothetical protein [Sporichthya sp.]|uniref:hypothetical protein n=1 Tax=Sporichthya sp. TaxID=65475 RepID=UPI0017F009C4|nr:hypothetical protein [Sporichthya sp.]MBA3743182.1 hypothetical protein [Sporichthya sp.]
MRVRFQIHAMTDPVSVWHRVFGSPAQVSERGDAVAVPHYASLSATRPMVTAMLQRRLVFERWSSLPGQDRFAPHDVCARLAARIAQDPEIALLQDREIATGIEVLRVGSDEEMSVIRLMALRTPDKRPLQWEPGTPLSPLQLLDRQYPADVTYMVLWPDGYAAQDLHGHAPRFGRLAHYLRKHLDEHVGFEPLFQPDTFARLMRMRGQLRRVEIAINKPEPPDLQPGAFRTLIPAVFGHTAPSVRVEIGVGRHSPRDRYLDLATEEAVIAMAQEGTDAVSSMTIKGRDPGTGASTTVNLLHERLQEVADLPRDTRVPGMPEMATTVTAFRDARQRLDESGELQNASIGQAFQGKGA